MAFNPFRAFRKHQKVVFAALVVVAMFVFVFTSSTPGTPLNDLFMAAARSVGLVKKPNNAKVAEVYGKDKTEQDLMDLAAKRSAALTVWLDANYRAGDALARRIQELSNPKTDKGSSADFFVEMQAVHAKLERLEESHESQIGFKFDDLFEQILGFRFPQGARAFGGSSVLPYAQRLLAMRQLSVDGLLEFMMWQKQADRLGIHLSADDTSKLFRTENNGIKAEDLFKNLRGHSRYARFKNDELMAALTEEYRVLLAKEAVLGSNSQNLPTPAPVTPFEFWEYYKKNRTQDTVAMLPIPVESYLDQVTEKPTDKELQKYFNAYSDELPNPRREKPAFKEPHRIQLSWLSANPDAPTLATAAAIAPELIRLFNPCQATILDVKLFDDYVRETKLGSYRAPRFNDIEQPPVSEASYSQAYSERLLKAMGDHNAADIAMAVGRGFGSRFPTDRAPQGAIFWTQSVLNPSPERQELAKRATAEYVAALEQLKQSGLVGTLSGVTGLGLDPSLAMQSTLQVAAAMALVGYNHDLNYLPYEAVKQKLQNEDRDLLINGRPQSQMADEEKKDKDKQENGFKAQFLDTVNKDLEGLKNMSRDDAKAAIKKAIDKNVLYVLSSEAFDTLKKKGVSDGVLEKLAKIKDIYLIRQDFKDQAAKLLSADEWKANEDKIVDAVAKVNLLKEEHSDGLRDEYELMTDTAMKPLLPDKFEPGDIRPVAAYFREGVRDFDVQKKDVSIGTKKEIVLYWKSQDVPEHVPDYSDAKTKEKVLHAWKLMKARELAQKDAQRLIDEAGAKAQGSKTPYQADAIRALADQRAKSLPFAGDPFEEKDIYLLAEVKDRNNPGHATWGPSMPSKDHIAFAPDDFAKQIHEKLGAVGAAMVMTDKPSKNCYIVVLEKREDVLPVEMHKYLTETLPGSSSWLPGSLRQHMERERLAKYRSDIIHQLRLEAGLDTDEPELDLSKNPKLDDFGNPLYKKTYTVSDDLAKKLQGDLARE